ncbi:hypothetical protein LSAT2_014444 [Lamellibrachia satsuma]|nr:hypothetical protein LSAT2_014444 [Lamellibrachia satsuma]
MTYQILWFRTTNHSSCFQHVTTSPHYTQSNGKAENAVKTVESLFTKCKEDGTSEFLALLHWRNTPFEGMGTSPSQRHMDRIYKTVLPWLPIAATATSFCSITNAVCAADTALLALPCPAGIALLALLCWHCPAGIALLALPCWHCPAGIALLTLSCATVNFCLYIQLVVYIVTEVFEEIFSYLTQEELCHKVAPVCRQWRDYAYDPIHWQSLDLCADTIANMNTFINCLERAPLLKSLSVCGCDRLTPAEISYVGSHCPQLTSLEIGFTRTAETGLCESLADSCLCLEHVNLEGCALIDTPCIAALCRIVTLSSVNLSHCNRLVGSDIVMLAERLPRLEKLNIDGVLHVADGDIQQVVELQGKHLSHLEIDGEQLTDKSLATISQCSNLEKFGITYADNLTDTSLQHLQKMRLEWLKLKKGVRLSTEALEALFVNCKASWSHLTHLDLTECTLLEDMAVSAVVKCCHRSLTYLALCWCWNITDTGLDIIVSNCLQQLPVTVRPVWYWNITDTGLDVVVSNCLQLQYLDLLGVHQITGANLDSIPVRMPRLLNLNLCQCNLIDDDVLLQLIHEMPWLGIVNYYGELLESDK